MKRMKHSGICQKMLLCCVLFFSSLLLVSCSDSSAAKQDPGVPQGSTANNVGDSTSNSSGEHSGDSTNNSTHNSSGDSTNNSTTSSDGDASNNSSSVRDNTPEVLVPEATGENAYTSDLLDLEMSNCSQGYVMINYKGTNEKTKFQVKTPSGTDYTYLVVDYNEYTVYPLPGENGTYTLTLLESVSPEEDLYAIAYSQTLDVTIADEFLPFLYPNHYVNFTADSQAVSTGASLAKDCHSDLDVVEQIYHYVTGNIVYDKEKAQNVQYGYTPDVDETLSTGEGICFDYAAVMTAMLRSQRIPSRLEVGYAGEVYHAWISCYVDEVGWVDNIIEFNGESWSLMDPTLAANNDRDNVQEYIGDGSKYMLKYTY